MRTYLCKISTKRLVFWAKIDLLSLLSLIIISQLIVSLLFGSKSQRYPFRLFVYSFIRLCLFSLLLSIFLFSFYFCFRTFVYSQMQTTRDKSVNLYLLLTHNSAILLLEFISECVDTKVNVCLEQEIAQTRFIP